MALHLQTSSAPPRSCSKVSSTPQSTPSSTLNSQQHSAPGHPKCNFFCSCLGHVEAKCFVKDHLVHQHNLPSSSTASPASTSSQTHLNPPQTASVASANALSSFAFQPDSHTSWDADIGMSAHMTFHHHRMQNLRPHHIQIRLADGSVVYSEGVGSVQFNPITESWAGNGTTRVY